MIVKQDILDADYRRSIYRQGHGIKHSLASAFVDSLPTVRELIDTLIREAEEIMARFKEWGMMDP